MDDLLGEAAEPMVHPKYRKSCAEVYLELNELCNFVWLNSEGARKLVKKFDKFHGSSHCQDFIADCDALCEMNRIIEAEVRPMITSIQRSYASSFCGGDETAAAEELSQALSEMLVWDRGTVWHDLIKLERQRCRLGIAPAVGGQRRTSLQQSNSLSPEDGKRRSSLVSPLYASVELKIPERGCWQFVKDYWVTVVIYTIVFAVFLSILLLKIPGLPSPAARCLALLWLASAFWSLGTVPLYVTGLAVPLLVVLLDTLPSSHGDRATAARMAMAAMWSGAQLMVLASFSLAAALSKLRIDKELACVLLRVASGGSRVRTLMVLMFLGYSTSAAVGNVAASVLCMSIASPILDELPQNRVTTLNYGRSLLVAIAFACNVGGMTSPVASPQSVVAFALLHGNYGLSFSEWCAVAIPTSFVLLLLTFWLLKPDYLAPADDARQALLSGAGGGLAADSDHLVLPPRLGGSGHFCDDWRRLYVIVVVLLTVTLWLCSSFTVLVFGDISLSALLPLVALFAVPDLLTKADFLSLPWDVCFLLAGGSALALAVRDSELLVVASGFASSLVEEAPLWVCILGTVAFVTLVSTLVSHTAAANVLMPFICSLAEVVVPPQVKGGVAVLGIPAALALSVGCALPISSTPNINATAIRRQGDDNHPWLKSSDFLRPGLPVSVVSIGVVASLGFLLSEMVVTNNVVHARHVDPV
ncbi:hypothetical protein FOZ62_026398 [Perkinsus olseni]|uniref:SPX domain-containing protein n=1 Tax=Perkinsus olseni TaxID=32597 RepID=A0A7J6RFM7_PEROL|nr:hypothetical protein FOZ62_026398 [Perkinsus olseni]